MVGFENITLKVSGQALLTHATLRVTQGDKVVVRGRSGCGKSSLLKCAAGLLPLSAGSIKVDGRELSAATVRDIRACIAFIGQEPVLGAERVREALLLPFRFQAHSRNHPDDDQVAGLLERLHLSETILEKPCKRISGGEKQRIAIVRALLLGKSIFLADEITSALDPESKTAVMQQLFQPDITLLSVSHDPAWVKACSRIVDIKDQQLKESRHEH